MNHAAAARQLLEARRKGPGPDLPERPTEDDAYIIQRLTMAALGPIGGWKVGAPSPSAPPSCAPLPRAGIHRGPATLPHAAFHPCEVESEIAFVLASDLPPRAAPYTRNDILSAIGTCHPGIEILDSRFAAENRIDTESNLADLIRHGAYVLGDPINHWRAIDFDALEVEQRMRDATLRRRGNPAGDMMRLITWLANLGAIWAGGLQAGDIVTCGSWTGKMRAAQGSSVTTQFDNAAPVRVTFDAAEGV